MTVWTVGHSTRSEEDLCRILEAHRIARVADVRRFPASRRHPHFHRDRLAVWLPAHGIDYVWLGDLLGGFREAPAGAKGLLAGYAAYRKTPAFAAGIARLEEIAGERPTAVFCAEAAPEKCHRSLLADALVEGGIRVVHVLEEQRIVEHALARQPGLF